MDTEIDLWNQLHPPKCRVGLGLRSQDYEPLAPRALSCSAEIIGEVGVAFTRYFWCDLQAEVGLRIVVQDLRHQIT